MSNDANEAKIQRISRIQRRKTNIVKKLTTILFVKIDEQRQMDVGDMNVATINGLTTELKDAVGDYKNYNDDLYDLMDDDNEVQIEMDKDNDLTLQMSTNLATLEELKEKLKPATTATAVPTPTPAPMPEREHKPPTRRAKVPDLKIPTFAGSFLEWDTFKETFDAIIGDKEDYTNVEKFQYLTAHLSGAAKQCIAGFPVIGDNYAGAYKLLKERFGNEHLVISAHMKQITQLKRVSRNSGELRKLSDSIQSHVRSLEMKGVDKGHFGTLLIPMIQDKIPDDVDLLISWKMGKEQ